MKAAAFIGLDKLAPRSSSLRSAGPARDFSRWAATTPRDPNDLPGQLPDPYSSASMPWSSRKRIVPSLFFVEITKRTRPWLLVSA